MLLGDEPWLDILRDFPDLDVLAVATPDHLHTQPILAALAKGAHVLTEKAHVPHDARGRSDHRGWHGRRTASSPWTCTSVTTPITCAFATTSRNASARRSTAPRISKSRSKFQHQHLQVGRVERSVQLRRAALGGSDLLTTTKASPSRSPPSGQKKRLIRDGINAYDAVQVRVDFDNGMSINFHNNWITPARL